MSGDVRRLPRWLAAPLPEDEGERLQALREYRILETPPEPVFDNGDPLTQAGAGSPYPMPTGAMPRRSFQRAASGEGTS